MAPHTIRWGILATGGIAETFTKDLLIDPSTRGVSDVAHKVVAAASSSSKDRAEKFLDTCGVPKGTAKAYGSYKELSQDHDIDIIYVATPHSHHYQNTRLCLEAGKNVLCEKAFTTNAAQAKKLVEIAKQKDLFLMEAVWTRYFPLSIELRKMVSDGKIGEVKRVFADNSFWKNVEEEFGTEHRMVNMDLAGGALLDLGIYSITWLWQFLYHILPADQQKPPTVASSMTKYHKTGADENTSMIFTFPSTGAQGIATTNLRVTWDPDEKRADTVAGYPIRIQGTKGEIQVMGPAFRPTKYRIIPTPDNKELKYEEVTKEIPGHGMFWEADECAYCLRDGKKESAGLPWQESIVIMEAMDEVRKQNNLVYPDKIETLDFPVEGM